MAQEVLTTLKEHPEAWTRVDTILEYSDNPQTKYYALQILEQVINTRWKVLPRDQCEGLCPDPLFFFFFEGLYFQENFIWKIHKVVPWDSLNYFRIF